MSAKKRPTEPAAESSSASQKPKFTPVVVEPLRIAFKSPVEIVDGALDELLKKLNQVQQAFESANSKEELKKAVVNVKSCKLMIEILKGHLAKDE